MSLFKKVVVVISILLVCIVSASVFGGIHNMISYSISPEYFTKFKMPQFGFDAYTYRGVLFSVVFIGVLATWWFGLLLGLLLAVTIVKYYKQGGWVGAMSKGVFFTLFITSMFSVIGALVGAYIVPYFKLTEMVPVAVVDTNAFMTAGTMHNFSYVGGLVGTFMSMLDLRNRSKSGTKAKAQKVF